MSCGENINVGVIDRDAARAGAQPRPGEQALRGRVQGARVRAASPLVNVGGLSGGNQQKVLLSRWLEIGPKVLILDEPTRGVDIGAKSEIYRIIDDLARSGIGVIVISSELPEVIGICDRVLVMREGHIEGEVGGPRGKPITQENIMALAAGVAGLKPPKTGQGRLARARATTATARRPGAGAGPPPQVRMRSMIQAIGMLPVLVILCVGFHYSDGRFFTPQNVSIVAQQAAINTVLAAGMTFVILTGGIDLSVGSILAASAMAAVIAR